MSKRLAYAIANVRGLLEEKPWRSWSDHSRRAGKRLAAETPIQEDPQDVDFSIFTPDKYIFSWATIVAGVEPDKNGYYIIPPHSKYVNENYNAWFNQVLLENYKSFILAENYLEHLQIPIYSKGKIIDAVAWVVRNKTDDGRKSIPTVFVDILVATSRKHRYLVSKIQSRKLKSLSMGCEITHSQCSKCGEIFEEEVDEPCLHITEEAGTYFTGEDGKTHRVAEMCGVPGMPGSCEFSEGSWVGVPAFTPAQRHGTLAVGEVATGRLLKAKVPSSRIKDAAKEY